MAAIEPGRDLAESWAETSENNLESLCFGRGVRWRVAEREVSRWSVSMSLPMGLAAVVLVVFLSGTSEWFTALGAVSGVDSGWATSWTIWLIACWCAGLVTQACVAWIWLSRRPIEHAFLTMTIGGVWTSFWTSRRDLPFDDARFGEHGVSASGVLMIWSAVLLVLVAGAMGFLLVDAILNEVNIEAAVANDSNSWTSHLSSLNQPFAAAAWMWCLQGLWQLLPLPQSLGRVGWTAMIGLFAGGDDASPALSTRVVRWWIVMLSFTVLLGGTILLQLSGIPSEPGVQAWPITAAIVLLALWLFASARSGDLSSLGILFDMTEDIGRLRGRVGVRPLLQRMHSARQEKVQQQRLRQAMDQEHSEAADASRVDEVLQRLHSDGVESLSSEDRDLLGRVSEALRKQRERES